MNGSDDEARLLMTTQVWRSHRCLAVTAKIVDDSMQMCVKAHLQICIDCSLLCHLQPEVCMGGVCCAQVILQSIALGLSPAALSAEGICVHFLVTEVFLCADKPELLQGCFALPAV